MRLSKTNGLAQRSSIIGRGLIRQMAKQAAAARPSLETADPVCPAKTGQDAK